MARKKHLINVHTSTGTTAPTGASLYLGEIAVQHTTNDPALWIKVGNSESSNTYEKFIGQTEINSLVGGASGLVNSLSASVVSNKTNLTNLSAVTLTGVTLNGDAVSVDNHVAALTGVQPTITDLETIRKNAASGKSAYDGYIAHSANTNIHVTAAQKTAWTNGANSGASAYTDVRNLSAVTITGVSMNGSNVTVTNKVATLGTVITAETKLSSASTGTGNVVTDIAVNDHKITFTKGLQVASDSDLKALSAATTAHTADTTAHITSTERTRWNNAWTSGVSAYTKVNQLSAGTIALVGASAASVYSSATTYTNQAISGLNSTTSVTAGNYITGIAIQNGKISGITESALPSETSVSTGNGSSVSSAAAAVITGITTGGTKGHTLTLNKSNKIFSASTSDSAVTSVSASTAANAAKVNNLTVETAVPTGAVFTDEHVTEVGNHYTASTATKTGGTTTSSSATAIKGITYDAAGHIVAVTSGSVLTSFTETQLSTATTGTGNVVTNLTVNNHEITMTKGITALTAITPNNTHAYLSATVASNSAITVGTKKAVVGDKTALGNVTATGSLVDAKAVKDYVEDQISSAVDYKGATGSTPSSAEKGDLYVASTGFTIGTGATAKTVEEGDFIIYDGTKWDVIEKNLTGAITGSLTADTLTLGDSTNSVKSLANGTQGQVLVMGANAPQWTAGTLTDTATTETGHYTPSASASTVGSTAGTSFIKTVVLDSKKHVISATTGTAITAQTQLSTATTGTGNVVGSIAVSDHKITTTMFSAASADQIAKLSAATVTHSGDTTRHITADERTRWNNAWTSGISAYTKVEELSAGTLYELKQTNHNIPYVVQDGDVYTGSTSDYTATCNELTELADGQSIIFCPKQASKSGNTYSASVDSSFASSCTLNLTLADGTTTGPKKIYLTNATKITTHLQSNDNIRLIYRENTTFSGTTGLSGWWTEYFYQTDANTLPTQLYGFGRVVSDQAIPYRYSLIMQTSAGTFNSITTTVTTAQTSSARTTGFVLGSPIIYYTSGAPANTLCNSAYSYVALNVLDFRYSSNCTSGASSNAPLTSGKPVYLVGTVGGDGLFYLDPTTWWSQDLPTTEDGKVYIFLGTACNTAQISLFPTHPVYEYKNGHVREYQEGQEIEMILGSAYTYTGISYVNSSTSIADAYSALTKELIDDEYVMSETMNFLNDKIDELSAETISEIQAISGDVLTISGIIEDNELVVAGALNELNSRVSELSASTASMGEGGILGSGYTYSGLSYVNSSTTIADAYSAITSIVLDNEEVVSAALNALYDDITAVSGYVEEVEFVAASALNDLNDRIGPGGELEQYLAENEELIAAGFNDLNNRVGELETHMNGDYIWLTSYDMSLVSGETPSDFELDESDTVNEAFAKLENRVGNDEEVTAAAINDLNDRLIDLEENGSSAAEEELLALSAVVVDNRDWLDDHTGNGNIHTNTTEKARWNNAWTSGVSAYTNVLQLSAATTAHTADTTAHVTSTERARWNNAWTSGVSAYTKVLQLSAGTTAHTANTTAHTTTAEKTRWNNAWTSGVSAYTKVLQLSAATTGMNSTLTGHTANTTVHITADERTRWQNGWMSGVSAYTKVTALSAATTAHTANTTVHVTADERTRWNNAWTSGVSAYTKVLQLSAATTAHTADTSAHLASGDRQRWDAGWTSGVSAYTLVEGLSGGLYSLSAKLITDEYVLASSLNDINNKVLTHSADTSAHVPVVDSGDNGKILRVVNGQWALVNPVAIYTGTTSPQSAQGLDGDIYLQF